MPYSSEVIQIDNEGIYLAVAFDPVYGVLFGRNQKSISTVMDTGVKIIAEANLGLASADSRNMADMLEFVGGAVERE